jgi:hypothetical protein
MAENKYRSATITVVANGFIVNIGCQTLVAQSPEILRNLVCDYLKDPQGAEKRLLLNSLNGENLAPPVNAPSQWDIAQEPTRSDRGGMVGGSSF